MYVPITIVTDPQSQIEILISKYIVLCAQGVLSNRKACLEFKGQNIRKKINLWVSEKHVLNHAKVKLLVLICNTPFEWSN